jgi:hypothetical protein|tara:strand:+ start:48 stop:221 length:174 start_codon:yes stop_codon:yes gene_type:complete
MSGMNIEIPQKKNTPAQQLLFHLQFMGIMHQSDRPEKRNEHYIKAQEIAYQLIDGGQ